MLKLLYYLCVFIYKCGKGRCEKKLCFKFGLNYISMYCWGNNLTSLGFYLLNCKK